MIEKKIENYRKEYFENNFNDKKTLQLRGEQPMNCLEL